MIGDPGPGIVGVTMNTQIINIVNATVLNIVSPITNGVGILNWTGAKTLTGVEDLLQEQRHKQVQKQEQVVKLIMDRG